MNLVDPLVPPYYHVLSPQPYIHWGVSVNPGTTNALETHKIDKNSPKRLQKLLSLTSGASRMRAGQGI